MRQLKLEVFTPAKKLVEAEADYVTLPGSLGELGILPGHIPVVTSLDSGVLSYKKDGVAKRLAVHYGFAEVYENKIVVLAKAAEKGSELNLERSRKTLEEILDHLKNLPKDASEKERHRLEHRAKMFETYIAACKPQ